MEHSKWNPFKGKGPDKEARNPLGLSQAQPYSPVELDAAPGPSTTQPQYSSGLELAPQNGFGFYTAAKYDSGLEVALQDEIYPERAQPQYDEGLQVMAPTPGSQKPAHPIISNPNRRIECGVWNEMKWYAGKGGLEMTMSRRSTLIKDTIWEVNGLGWGILWIRGRTRSLNRERHFTDPKGNPLFVMQKQDLSTRVAQTADGRVLFSIKRALGLKPQFSAEFTNVWDEQAVTWDVKGSPVRRGLDVTCNGVLIG